MMMFDSAAVNDAVDELEVRMYRSSFCKTNTKRVAALAATGLMVLALMAMGAPISQAKGYLSPPALPSEPPEPAAPPDCYPLLITVSPSGGGTVNRNPAMSPGCQVDGTYLQGAQVELTMSPNADYGFLGWGGDAPGSASPTVVTIDVDPEVTANFAPCYSLYVWVAPYGAGTVSRTPPNCPGDKYLAGTIVTLTANPTLCYNFVYWTGNYSSLYNPIFLTMSYSRSTTANFVSRHCVYVPVVLT
jgi:hypothetical protein